MGRHGFIRDAIKTVLKAVFTKATAITQVHHGEHVNQSAHPVVVIGDIIMTTDNLVKPVLLVNGVTMHNTIVRQDTSVLAVIMIQHIQDMATIISVQKGNTACLVLQRVLM